MATVQNAELEGVLQGLVKLAALQIPVTLSLKVRRMTRQLQAFATDVNEERTKIIDTYAEKTPEGKWVIVPGTKNVKFPDSEAEYLCETALGELGKARSEELSVIKWEEFGPKITDTSRADHFDPEGLGTILILLGDLFEE